MHHLLTQAVVRVTCLAENGGYFPALTLAAVDPPYSQAHQRAGEACMHVQKLQVALWGVRGRLGTGLTTGAVL
jgi:hypothetical protein